MNVYEDKVPYRITLVESEADIDTIRRLFRAYETFLAISLSFQGFDKELQSLPGRYANENNGGLYLVYFQGQPVGCGAYYKLEDGIAEIKRMYIDTEYQGQGLGKHLMHRMMADAKAQGYHTVKLDTLKRLMAANRLYKSLGFQDAERYNDCPHPDVQYMQFDLSAWDPPRVLV
jgi:putative acetyltransferase